jgi:hypothetical protein
MRLSLRCMLSVSTKLASRITASAGSLERIPSVPKSPHYRNPLSYILTTALSWALLSSTDGLPWDFTKTI